MLSSHLAQQYMTTFSMLAYSLDPLQLASFSLLWLLFKYVLGSNFRYRTARWGLFGHVAAFFRVVDTQAVRDLHWNINTWSDDEVIAWKTSYMSACGAIAVAGAIFSSVGLTALQLPNMDSTHWSARALFSCSMILGILSVVYAAAQQQDIGMLNNALEIRLWLSRGKIEPNKREYDMPFKLLPLESSVSALKMFYMPKVMLTISVWLYAVGFGIYLLYAWLYHVESNGGPNDFRNIFIVFVITVGLVYIYTFVLFVLSQLDAAKRSRDFDLDRSQGFAKPDSRKQLEEWLKALKDMQSINIEEGQEEREYRKLETQIDELKKKWDELRRAREEKRKKDFSEKHQAKISPRDNEMQHRAGRRVKTDPESLAYSPKEASSVPQARTWS